MAPLPPRDQGHLWLRYQVVGYTEEIVHILSRGLRRYSGGRFAYTEEMEEDRFEAYWLGSERVIPDKGDLSEYWARVKVTATDLFYLCSMDQGTANVSYLLAQYLFRHAEGRKSGARLFGGHFIGRLAHNFGLVSDDGLRGLSIVTRELLLIDMGELVKLNICIEIGDDWAWVAPRPKRHPDVADGAPGAAEDAPAVDEGVEADPTPIQAPQPSPPPAARTMT
ncbi:hypothetical protein Tco_1024904 [Tanacetum coccineum]